MHINKLPCGDQTQLYFREGIYHYHPFSGNTALPFLNQMPVYPEKLSPKNRSLEHYYHCRLPVITFHGIAISTVHPLSYPMNNLMFHQYLRPIFTSLNIPTCRLLYP